MSRRSPASLPLALAARAEGEPHQPWLFQREAWDWRWRSWARVAEQVQGAARALGHLEPASRVAFDARAGCDAVALDLAIQAAGLVSVPVWEGSAAARLGRARVLGCRAWAGVSAEAGADTAGLERVLVPEARPRLEPWRRAPAEPVPAGRGGAVVGARGAERELSQDELLELAARLGGEVPSRRRRHVALGRFGLDHPGGRALAAWSLLTGAALLIEDDPEELVPGVLWTRPTVVLGTADELERVAAAYGERRHRRWSRLAAFLLVADSAAEAAEPEPAAAEALRGLGVVVARPGFPPWATAGRPPGS